MPASSFSAPTHAIIVALSVHSCGGGATKAVAVSGLKGAMGGGKATIRVTGGGSLAGAAEFRAVARILMETGGGARAAVVSASAGITDRLMALVDVINRSSWRSR